MRLLRIIPALCLLACNQSETIKKVDKPLERYWVSKHLQPYDIDSAVGGGQTIYGSGSLLRLDTNGHVASLGADFYWKNDSLFQGGEPGMTIKYGQWQRSNQNLILSQNLLAKDIMLTSDRIGQTEVDTVVFLGDSLLIYKRDTLLPVSRPSTELELLLNGIISFHLNKNRS